MHFNIMINIFMINIYKHRYQIQKMISNLNYNTDEAVSQNYMYAKFRNCVLMHKEAIRYVFTN